MAFWENSYVLTQLLSGKIFKKRRNGVRVQKKKKEKKGKHTLYIFYRLFSFYAVLAKKQSMSLLSIKRELSMSKPVAPQYKPL